MVIFLEVSRAGNTEKRQFKDTSDIGRSEAMVNC